MTPNSILEVTLEDFDDCVDDVSNALNQDLQLVPQQVSSSRKIVLHSSGDVNSVGVSSIDGGGLHSSGFVNVNSVGISGIEGGRDGSSSSLNPKPFKKKICYNPRQETKGVKKRLIWTDELNQHFLEIYNSSPNEKPVPKQILEKMRERFPYITRENVASHLQKHRLLEKKLKMKNNKELGSSSKCLPPKPLPLKVTKKPNFQSTHNSPNPNSHQILQQSHSISTSSNSHQQIHLQSHSISTSSNSHLIIPQQNPNNLIQQHSTLLQNDQMMTFHQNSVHGGGGGTNIYSNSNLINVCEIQENPNWAPPRLGQSSNNAANDLTNLNANPYHFPNISNQIFNVDAYNGNGYGLTRFQYPRINNCNDYVLEAQQNFGIKDDYHMNLDYVYNHICALERCSEALDQFGYPLSFNTMNELQNDFEEAIQTIILHPNRNLDDVSTEPQTIGNHHLHPYLLPQLDANPSVEHLSNSTIMNASFQSNGNHDHLRRDENGSDFTTMNASETDFDHSRRDGNGSDFTTMNGTFSSETNFDHSRRDGNGLNFRIGD